MLRYSLPPGPLAQDPIHYILQVLNFPARHYSCSDARSLFTYFYRLWLNTLS